MERSKTKWILGIFGVVILGGLGSGFWQIALKPFFHWFSEIAFNVITLGLSSLSDNFYRGVARGLYEGPSLATLYVVLTILGLAFAKSWGDISGKRKAERINKEFAEKLDKCKSLPPEERASITEKIDKERNEYIEVLKRSVRRSDQRWVIWMVLFFSFLVFQAVTINLQNNAITGFRQAFAICKPLLSDQEEEEILSEFSMIKNKQDYVRVLNRLIETSVKKTVKEEAKK